MPEEELSPEIESQRLYSEELVSSSLANAGGYIEKMHVIRDKIRRRYSQTRREGVERSLKPGAEQFV